MWLIKYIQNYEKFKENNLTLTDIFNVIILYKFIVYSWIIDIRSKTDFA